MLIDCDTCAAPARACRGCVMTVLLRGRAGGPAGRVHGGSGRGASDVELDDAERDAIGALARAGLVPPLRLVRGVSTAEAPWTAEPPEAWAAQPAEGIA